MESFDDDPVFTVLRNHAQFGDIETHLDEKSPVPGSQNTGSGPPQPNKGPDSTESQQPNEGVDCLLCRQTFSNQSLWLQHISDCQIKANTPEDNVQLSQQFGNQINDDNDYSGDTEIEDEGEPDEVINDPTVVKFDFIRKRKSFPPIKLKLKPAKVEKKCPECGKEFKSNTHLKRHYLIHTGERPFPCDQCDKSFRRAEHLRRHLDFHNGVKPYYCEICEKSFARHHYLRDHIEKKHNIPKSEQIKSDLLGKQLQDGSDVLICHICGNGFRTQHNLNRHLKTHSGVKPHECKTCSKTFARPEHLQRHLQSHGGSKNYCCDKCGRLFSRMDYLKYHVTKGRCIDWPTEGRRSEPQPDEEEVIVTDPKVLALRELIENGITVTPHKDVEHYMNANFDATMDTLKADNDSLDKSQSKILKSGNASNYGGLDVSMATRGAKTNSDDDDEDDDDDDDDESFEVQEFKPLNEPLQVQGHGLNNLNKTLQVQGLNNLNEPQALQGQGQTNLNKPLLQGKGQKDVSVVMQMMEEEIRIRKARPRGESIPMKCPQCDLTFDRPSRLKIHVMRHTGERPFQCTLCEKSFLRKNHLRDHINLHYGIRPHQCKYCERTFTRMTHVRRHILVIHGGIKPFACTVCSKSFSRHQYLADHMTRVHQISSIDKDTSKTANDLLNMLSCQRIQTVKKIARNKQKGSETAVTESPVELATSFEADVCKNVMKNLEISSIKPKSAASSSSTKSTASKPVATNSSAIDDDRKFDLDRNLPGNFQQNNPLPPLIDIRNSTCPPFSTSLQSCMYSNNELPTSPYLNQNRISQIPQGYVPDFDSPFAENQHSKNIVPYPMSFPTTPPKNIQSHEQFPCAYSCQDVDPVSGHHLSAKNNPVMTHVDDNKDGLMTLQKNMESSNNELYLGESSKTNEVVRDFSEKNENCELICDSCGEVFIVEKEFNEHQLSHNKTCTFRCLHCDLFFETEDELTRHNEAHIDSKFVFCDLCGEGFGTVDSFREHIPQCYGLRKPPLSNNPNPNSVRQGSGSIATSPNNEALQSSPGVSGKTDTETKQFRNELDTMLNSPDVSSSDISLYFLKQFGCADSKNNPSAVPVKDECKPQAVPNVEQIMNVPSLTFSSLMPPSASGGISNRVGNDMDSSEKVGQNGLVSLEDQLTCGECGKILKSKKSLAAHKATHLAVRPHACPICEKSFTKLSHVRRHQLTHDGIKAFECDICNKKFTRQSHVTRHKVLHVEESAKLSNNQQC